MLFRSSSELENNHFLSFILGKCKDFRPLRLSRSSTSVLECRSISRVCEAPCLRFITKLLIKNTSSRGRRSTSISPSCGPSRSAAASRAAIEVFPNSVIAASSRSMCISISGKIIPLGWRALLALFPIAGIEGASCTGQRSTIRGSMGTYICISDASAHNV